MLVDAQDRRVVLIELRLDRGASPDAVRRRFRRLFRDVFGTSGPPQPVPIARHYMRCVLAPDEITRLVRGGDPLTEAVCWNAAWRMVTAGSPATGALATAASRAGLAFYREGFADRATRDDGTLVLELPASGSLFQGEAVERRLGALGRALGLARQTVRRRARKPALASD